MRYSLSNYRLAITIPASLVQEFGIEKFTVGGEGSYTDSITISYNDTLFTTRGDATGSWVHEMNLSRVGTATVSLSQVSPQVVKFKRLCNLFYSATNAGDEDGLTIVLTDSKNQVIATCVDCYISRIPDQGFSSSVANQSWVFTCGKITFN